jgi:hypothetical protein
VLLSSLSIKMREMIIQTKKQLYARQQAVWRLSVFQADRPADIDF